MTPSDRRKLAAALTEATGREWRATTSIEMVSECGDRLLLGYRGTRRAQTLMGLVYHDYAPTITGRGWHARLAADVAARLRGER
jgi:hypothetical protein